MSTIKRCVKSPTNPLAQVVGRLEEKLASGSQMSKPFQKKINKGHLVKNGLVKTCAPDNCIRLTMEIFV